MSLMKKLTSALVAGSLVLGLVGTAFAAPATDVQAAAERMAKLGLVTGKDASNPNDYQLGDTIKRAELMTILVRAYNQENAAKILKGANAFPDTASHWASGYIQVAKNIIVEQNKAEMGMPDGTFAPEGQVTAAQAVAFLMKFIGVQRDTTKAWPNDYLDKAVEVGLISADDKATIVATNGAATRGLVFYLADRGFGSYPLPSSGKTVYQTYTRTAAPTLTVDDIDVATTNTSVTISGTVGATATEVRVGTTTASKVVPVSAGKFSTTVDLAIGDNSLVVSAKDIVGNTANWAKTVVRSAGEVASVKAELSSALLKAGGTADLSFKVFDKNNAEIEGAKVAVEVVGNIGTYADGVFTAATTPATGKLVVTAAEGVSVNLDVAVVAGDLATINIEAPVSSKIGAPVQLKATGADANGNAVEIGAVEWDYTAGGVVSKTGVFAGVASGTVTVTATAGGVTGTKTISVYGDAAALKVDAPTGLIANGADTKTVTVRVADASGATVGTATNKVTLTSTNGNIKVVDANGAKQSSVAVNAVNGVATFTVVGADDVFTATTSGASLSATADTLTGDLVSVSTVAPVISKVVLSASPSGIIEIGGTSTITATVKDSTGVSVFPGVQLNVQLTADNGVLGNNGVITINANAKTGSVQLTAPQTEKTMNLSGTITTANVTYPVEGIALNSKIAGPAYKLAIVSAPVDNNADSGSFTIKVAVQDGLGTTKTTLTGNNALTVSAQAKKGNVTVNGSGATVNGIATIEFRTSTAAELAANPARVSNALTSAGTWTFTVSQGNLIVPEAVTANVTPGAVHHFSDITASPATLTANGNQVSTLSVDILDAAGNKVPTATTAVTFKRLNNTTATTLPSTLTVNAVNGTASIVVTAGVTDGAFDDFQVEGKIDANTFVGNSNNAVAEVRVTTQIVGYAAGLQFATIAGTPVLDQANAQVAVGETAGTAFDVSFNVVDATAAGARVVSTDNNRSVTITAYSGSTAVDTQTVTTVNGVAKASFSLTKSGNYTFKASSLIAGNTVEVTTAGGTGTALVMAAAPTSIAIDAPLTAVETGTQLALTVSAKDAYGNSVAGGLSNFAWSTTDTHLSNQQNGAGTATFTAANTEQTTTIAPVNATATWTPTSTNTAVDNLPVTAATISTYIAGPAYSIGVVTAPANATAGTGTSTLVLGVYDGAGHLKTSINGTQQAPYTITLAASANSAALPGNIANLTASVVNGKATFNFTGANTAGNYSIDATHNGLVSATGIAFTVVPGAAKAIAGANTSLTADGSSIVYLQFRVTDGQNGNTVSSYSGTMTFTSSGTGATLLQTSAPIVNGIATVAVRATTQAGSFVVTPAVSDSAITTNGTATVTVNAGAVASITASAVNATGTTANIILVLKDRYGNAVKGAEVVGPNGVNWTFTSAATVDANNVTHYYSDASGIITASMDRPAAADGTYTITSGSVTTTVVVAHQ